MIRWAVAVLLLAASIAGAPAAAADPADLVPDCSSGQVAAPGECTPVVEDIPDDSTDDSTNAFSGAHDHPLGAPGAFPGANPNLPLGPTPRNFPVVIPLGVTPFNVPSNLPLGPTPPSGFPFPVS